MINDRWLFNCTHPPTKPNHLLLRPIHCCNLSLCSLSTKNITTVPVIVMMKYQWTTSHTKRRDTTRQEKYTTLIEFPRYHLHEWRQHLSWTDLCAQSDHEHLSCQHLTRRHQFITTTTDLPTQVRWQHHPFVDLKVLPPADVSLKT